MSNQEKISLCNTLTKLLQEGYISSQGTLSTCKHNTLYITPADKDLTHIGVEDIVEIPLHSWSSSKHASSHQLIDHHVAIYKNRSDISAIIHATSPALLAVSHTKEVVKPLLDDMAQLIGLSIRSASPEASPKHISLLLKRLKRRNAIFITGEGALCGAGSLDDAHAVCQVTEKASQAWIESSFLGGGHKISPIESALMRWVYLKKYSKKNSTNT